MQRRNDTYSQEDQDSQFRCCLFQAIVKSSCLGILWQSRFAHDLQVSRSVSSAEHGSRQLSWRTCGLTRRTKNHGTSLGEATGAFRRNTVYHVTSSTKSEKSANLCVVFKCTALARTNDREKKKRLLNDTRYKQTPTRMVVWNRVTLDNQHQTMKNKCCTISHKARNRRPRKQMWFTSRHIKCWYFPPRKDRCKTAVLHTLDVQPLNKTHHTHTAHF